MNMSFWFAIIGIAMNLAGTMLLVFSVPVILNYNPLTGNMKIAEPNKNQSGLKFSFELFRDIITKKENRFILLPLFLLAFGALFQIIALQPDLINSSMSLLTESLKMT